MTTFFTWFYTYIWGIMQFIFACLKRFEVYPNVNLLDFIITITILGAFLPVLVSIATTYRVSESKATEKPKKEKES